MININKRKIIISSIICFSLLIVLAIILKVNYRQSCYIDVGYKCIIENIEDSMATQTDITDTIDSTNEYLEGNVQNSEYYFIKGYLDFISRDSAGAIENFKLCSQKLTKEDMQFVKIYTYVLLNESLQMEGRTDSVVENCRTALNYISKKNPYKNDMGLIWRTITVLINDKANIEEAVNMLKHYKDNVRGLTDETRVRLIPNIGQLYTLIYRYSDATYCYLDALHILDTKKDIPDSGYYRGRLLTIIGDVNYALTEYETAIDYYDQSIAVPIEDPMNDATSKVMAMINKSQSYLELKKYKLAYDLASEVTDLLPYINQSILDDMSILQNNILALSNIYQHDFEEAEKELKICEDLLAKNGEEFSATTQPFIELAYANLYREQKLYDKALVIYKNILKESVENRIALTASTYSNEGLHLTEKIYFNISQVYKEINDLQNYIYYNNLYIKESDKNTNILRKENMKYIYSMYESDLMKQQSNKYQFNLLVMFFFLFIILSISVNKTRSIRMLRKSNFTDSMTGLNNRKYLDYYMKKYTKQLLDKEMSIMILDIDHFKKYNDNYGHIEGDKIIKEVATTLRNSVRKSDIVVRYGGEEMVLIFTGVSPQDTEMIAKKIQANLSEKNIEHKYSDVSDILTVSIGIYNTIYTGSDVYALINKADIALYEAKKSGRNRYEILDDSKL